MADWWQDLIDKFTIAFVDHNRWKFITQGLANTLIITFFAVIMGIVIGFIVSVIRVTHDKTGKLKVGNAICQVYLAVIRGTPVMVQIMIIYFVIFAAASTSYKIPLAILAFGINSGAYVAEIFRGGINAIDAGQFEAGRSLGCNYVQTMWYIIAPQAFKNAIPPLANEFIVLLKETSVAGYIGVEELTRGAFSIGGSTYDYTLPLLAVALIYLAMVVGLSRLVALLERRLRRSER
ncbi:MAG: amino acid ABC transporter permease [Christensenellaceae bacterium]|nr:amino acid ABC transporter permease [Christensenellaceae bacterium]